MRDQAEGTRVKERSKFRKIAHPPDLKRPGFQIGGRLKWSSPLGEHEDGAREVSDLAPSSFGDLVALREDVGTLVIPADGHKQKGQFVENAYGISSETFPLGELEGRAVVPFGIGVPAVPPRYSCEKGKSLPNREEVVLTVRQVEPLLEYLAGLLKFSVDQ